MEVFLSRKSIDRRGFLRGAAGAVGASAILPACDPSEESSPPTTFEEVFFEDDFGSTGTGWGNRWFSFRSEAAFERVGGAGVMSFAPAVPRAVTPDTDQMEYMVQPIVVKELQGADVDVRTTVELEGDIEAGLVCRASFDQSYALLVTGGEVLLCHYTVADRVVLDRASLPRAGKRALRMTAVGDRIRGAVAAGDDEVLVEARDAALGEGLVGTLANPRDERISTRALFSDFSARGSDPRWRAERLLYRFAGAVIRDGDAFKARVTARTEIPTAVAFEVATEDSFEGGTRTAWLQPDGGLGAVHGWLEGLRPDTAYFWRPIFMSLDEEVLGATASLHTPPPPGAPTRFVFASCTSGRVAAYPSFRRAASLEPSFYVHAGDWGYADLNAVVRSGDHFQGRWIRLLRTPEIAELLSKAPLMFWQDDHDYQADNGWSKTVKPYAVRAFDELHANPTDDYFDIRWGDAHVFCLDCRLYASDPEAPDDPDKTRIGPEQKAWLKQAMGDSDAPLLVVASAMAFRDKVDDDPGWHNVYTTERDELLGFFARLDQTVVVLSGDSHGQRLIHHFEFGELYEITSSGTDFPGGSQGRNDPEHTQIYSPDNGIALIELDPEGPGRSVKVSVVSTEDGSIILEKVLPI